MSEQTEPASCTPLDNKADKAYLVRLLAKHSRADDVPEASRVSSWNRPGWQFWKWTRKSIDEIAFERWKYANAGARDFALRQVIAATAADQTARRIGPLSSDGELFLALRVLEWLQDARGNALEPWANDAYPQTGDLKQVCKVHTLELKRLLRELFEFRTGPIVPQALTTQPGGVPSEKTRRTSGPGPNGAPQARFNENPVPGCEPDQNVFLAASGAAPRSLDGFADDVVVGNVQDGIYAVAGPRGSGKSTVLIRIHALCKSYARGEGLRARPRAERSWRPLLVRFDLGVGFDEKRFPLEFMAQTCNAVKAHCTTRPATHDAAPNWVRHALGEVGRWCETNSLWALLMTIALSAAVGISFVSKDTQSSFEKLISRDTVCLTANFLLSVCAVSAMYRFAGRSERGRRLDPSPWIPALIATAVLLLTWEVAIRPGPIECSRRVVGWFGDQVGPLFAMNKPMENDAQPAGVVAGGTAAATADAAPPANSDASQSASNAALAPASQTSPSPTSNAAAAASSTQVATRKPPDAPSEFALGMRKATLVHWVLAGTACASILLLPGWWWTYAYCQSLAGALRSKADAAGGVDLPYLSGFSKLIGTVLPKLPDGGDIRDMDTPFAVEKLKDLLRRCVADFERVVILVDDVDVTPDHQYPQLMQLLRPLNKIPGVCCVLAAPTEFYDKYRKFPADDYHSTLQDCLLVGDGRYTQQLEQLACCDPAELHARLESLLLPIFNSHCVLQRSGDYEDQGSPLVRLLVALWHCTEPDKRMRDAARRGQIVRRDLVRAAAALLES